MTDIITIIKKELFRVFSDKRLLFSTFILPPFMLIVIYSIMGMAIGNLQSDIVSHNSIIELVNPPIYFEEFYNSKDIEYKIEKMASDYDINQGKDKLLKGIIDLIIVFPDKFNENIDNYKTTDEIPDIKTYYNPNEDYSSKAYSISNDLLSDFENFLLEKRFENFNEINVFNINKNNSDYKVVDEKKAVGEGLSLIVPMLIIVFLFAGAMGMGIDLIAGEKERGTMATMLVTPIKRKDIAMGKMISLSIIATISAVCSFIGIVISLPLSSRILLGGLQYSAVTISYGLTDYFMLLTVMITVVGVFVGLICLVSIYAKNVKEAGTYMGPIYMLVLVGAFGNIFPNKELRIWEYAIPVYGTTSAIKRILNFEITWTEWAIVCSSSILISIILANIIGKMFDNEKVMFGK